MRNVLMSMSVILALMTAIVMQFVLTHMVPTHVSANEVSVVMEEFLALKREL